MKSRSYFSSLQRSRTDDHGVVVPGDLLTPSTRRLACLFCTTDHRILVATAAGRRLVRSADTTKLSVQRTIEQLSRQSFCSICCSHLEQSIPRELRLTSSTWKLNILRQLDDVTAAHWGLFKLRVTNVFIMNARSAMRPCYILPMFFIFFYGRPSWPNGWTDLHETFTRGRY